MTEINDLVAELADDLYVRGISPSQPFKPMTNNELTIDQELTSDVLKEIAGGPHFNDWSTAFAQRPFGVTRSNQMTNNELTLEQLQGIAGGNKGGTATGLKRGDRCNLKDNEPGELNDGDRYFDPMVGHD